MRKALRNTAVLALPALINAVALSDMTPRATDLPPACENLYTAQISGCVPSDFTSKECSSSCVSSLEALVGPIQKACGGQGVSGQNLVVAFLAGVGPQQLCHNAGSGTTTTAAPTTSTTETPTTTQSPSIVSSTTTAQSATNTKSLIVDTSSSMSATSKTSTTSGVKHTTKHTPIPIGSSSAPQTSSHTNAAAGTSHTSSTKTTSASGNSQTNLNDGSGGGSPFDTPGNLINAAAGRSVSMLSLFLPAVAAVMFATLR